ncbi:MAG: FMN-binding protein [Roseburia sp.]
MGIVMGYICLICFILLAGKYVARKSNCAKVNSFFLKIHKPLSLVFLLACIIHLVLVFPVLKGRDILVTISGILCLGILILLIVLCHVIKEKKQKMFWHRLLTVALLIMIAFHVIVYVIDFKQYKNKISDIEIDEVEISEISDGAYIGEYDAGYIYAKVQVTVEDGEIKKVEILEHRNERGQKAESIVENIVEEQSLNVDAVSGATNSSLVIKKACENALKKKS